MLAVAVAACPVLGRLQLRYSALLPYGPDMSSFVFMDSDRDSLLEFCFDGYESPDRHWGISEYRPVDRYEIVQADTAYMSAAELKLGNFMPHDVGDIDRDGLLELAGELWFVDTAVGLRARVVCTIEGSTPTSHPRVLKWRRDEPVRGPSNARPVYITDLDRDSLLEITTPWLVPDSWGLAVFENVADDEESLVYHGPPIGMWTWYCDWGDFDENGRTDVLTSSLGTRLYVLESTGDNQLAPVCTLGYGVHPVGAPFHGCDADQNGHPEFFVGIDAYLYMLEADAEHHYAYYRVDNPLHPGTVARPGVCADLDGDGIEEVSWPYGSYVRVLKAVAPHQFDSVCVIHSTMDRPKCGAADFNRNGYNELYVGSEDLTLVLEVEAIRLVYPSRSGLQFQAGDTCWIRWDTFTPPRCDSVSLFLRTDSVVPQGRMFWDLDTVVTGLPPGDTTYPWIVPDTVLDAAWIVAIAYGPGWQYSASLAPFRILSSGIAERSRQVFAGLLPEPTIVGRVLWLSGQNGDCPSGGGPVPALLDISGRKVMDLAPGPNDIRHLAPGVYFVRREEDNSTTKVVVQK